MDADTCIAVEVHALAARAGGPRTTDRLRLQQNADEPNMLALNWGITASFHQRR